MEEKISRVKKIRESVAHYERHISAAAIVFAFIFDSVTLHRLDFFLTELVLILYIVVSGTGIFLINLREEGKLGWISEAAYWWIFVAVQFSFGGLFGRFLIYYSRSGSLFTSWPFLLLLLVLLIGNEFAKKHYTKLLLQISFFFLCLFSFLIFFVPIVFGRMSEAIFVLAGFLSLAGIYAFLRFMYHFIPNRIAKSRLGILGCVGAIYISLNVLYFTNIIPPIPLSLREAGVYHSVIRTSLGYRVTHEAEPPFSFFRFYETLHLAPGEAVYLYSSVFAPTNFDAYVVHDWERYDLESKKWIDSARIPFPIIGGDDRGYRGYTLKSDPEPGFWRVNIETFRGQIVGRVEFKVVKVEEKPELFIQDL